MAKPILVTGATGNVGREVVRVLEARGVSFRMAGRGGGSARGADTARLDFGDPRTFGPAVEGCGAVFLVRPPAIADVAATLVPFIDEARRRGALHVVFLSVAGAGANPLVPHHAVERHLAAERGLWTVLRPGFFAQNLGDAYRRDIVEESRIYVPAGSGRVAFVDVRDVAEVAALAFADPVSFEGRALTLTGPEAVGFDAVAATLTEALGREVRYEAASLLGYARHLHRRGMPAGQIAVQAILHAGLRLGQAEAVDPTLREVLGRPGRTVREYVRDHLPLWQAAADR